MRTIKELIPLGAIIWMLLFQCSWAFAQEDIAYNASLIIEISEQLVWKKSTTEKELVVGVLGVNSQMSSKLIEAGKSANIKKRSIVFNSFDKIDNLSMCDMLVIPNMPQNHTLLPLQAG